jgi:translocation protein SEC63
MSSASSVALRVLEKNVEAELGARLLRMRQQFKRVTGKLDARWDSLILLYAHLLRLPIEDSAVQKRTSSLRNEFYKASFSESYPGQTQVLLQSPTLLNALLAITTARNWSQPSIAAMRLHAYLAQGILPGSQGARWAQLPGLQKSDIRALPAASRDFADVITHLEEQKNNIAEDARKAMERWGRIEIVDAKFRGMSHYI